MKKFILLTTDDTQIAINTDHIIRIRPSRTGSLLSLMEFETEQWVNETLEQVLDFMHQPQE